MKNSTFVCVITALIMVIVVSATLSSGMMLNKEGFRGWEEKGKQRIENNEVDIDKIIENVFEATEDVGEPNEGDEPDPEDEADYLTPPGEGGPGDTSADDDAPIASGPIEPGGNPKTNRNYRRVKPQRKINKVKRTKKGLPGKKQQPKDYVVSDLLEFALVEKSSKKRLICVLPDTVKSLYIIRFNTSVSTALLIGAKSEKTVFPEMLPKDVSNVIIFDEDEDTYDKIIKDVKYVIFYGNARRDPFWKWLNTKRMRFTFVDYIGVSADREAKSAVLTRYPYFYVNTTDVNTFLPGHTFANRFVATLNVPVALYSVKPFKDEFMTLYDRYSKSIEYQLFYELFFDYYPEILSKRLGVEKSINLKMAGLRETFEASKPSRVHFLVDKRLKSIDVLSTIRSSFKEVKVSYSELARQVLRARIKRLDVISIKNQEHRSLEGKFYVVHIDELADIVLLQSKILLKNLVKYTQLDSNGKLVAGGYDKTFTGLMMPYDKVFFKQLDKPGVYLSTNPARRLHFFQIYDDTIELDMEYKCITDSKLQLKEACLSEYDPLGNLKPMGADVWDRPCAYDEECPFFRRGKYDKYRGGCNDGYCEMPLGFTLIGYRNYAVNENMLHVQDGEVRFPGDMFGQKNISKR